MQTSKLLVVADDLTGANDSAVSFAEIGLKTLLKMDISDINLKEGDVYSISLNTRPLKMEEAQQSTYTYINTRLDKIDEVYLKIDSTMRGSVSGQISGALKAWSRKYADAIAIVCPAYPDMGRTIEEGRLLVDSIPVHKTASGKDRICPVKTANMQALLPKAVYYPHHTKDDLLAFIEGNPKKAIIVNAKTNQELVAIAKTINQLGPRAIGVGSAGLAKALCSIRDNRDFLPKPLTSKGRIIIVVTSIHDISQAQVDEYIGSQDGRDSIVFSPHPRQLLAEGSFTVLRNQLFALAGSGDGPLILRANPAQISSENITQIAEKIAKIFANLAKDIIEEFNFQTLLLVGGDGANALLAAIKVNQLQIIGSLVEGVPLGVSHDNQKKTIITKSGGFGSPDLLIQIMGSLAHVKEK